MEIEDVDSKDIIVENINIKEGLTNNICERVVEKLGLNHIKEDAINQMKRLYEMFLKKDAT